MAGFDGVVEMLCSLFVDDPFQGLQLSLASNLNEGIFVLVETIAEKETVGNEMPSPESVAPADEL